LDDSAIQRLIRQDFPFLQACHYLDSASVCPAPRQTVDVMSSFYFEHPLNYGVGEFLLSRKAKASVDRARETVAEFVGAFPDEIVFTKNTTEAINTVARGLHWQEGDGVVLTTLEHQSNIIPWLRVAEDAKLNVYYLAHGNDGLVSPTALKTLLENHRIRMVALTHVSNVLGTIQDVSTLVGLAKERGALTLIDAAQSAGRVPVDVAGIGCDFATFCGRKALMGPQGTGFLYGRKELLKDLMPLTVGSRAADTEDGKQYHYQAPPHRFEAGVLNTSGVIGLSRSIQYLSDLGSRVVTQRITELSRVLLQTLAERKGIVVHSPRSVEAQAGIVSWSMPGTTPTAVSQWLDKEMAVAVATGHQGSRLVTRPLAPEGIIRTSVHWFNTNEDIGALADGLDRFLKDR
jgi:cysteine desulfurase / selenocysteine lyase